MHKSTKQLNILDENIIKLIGVIALPAVLSLVFTTLFNFTDTYFVGQLPNAKAAGAAMSVTFPVYMLLGAVGVGLSSATGAIIGNKIGQNKAKEARGFAHEVIALSTMIALVFSATGWLFAWGAISLLTHDAEIQMYALRYIVPMFIATPFFMVQGIFSSLLTVQGKTMPQFYASIVAFGLNVLLDWLFIAVFPLDTLGVSLATIMVQIFVFVINLYFLRRTELFRGEKKMMKRPTKETIQDITKLGVPSALSMAVMSFGMIVLSYFIGIRVGSPYGLAALGAGQRAEQFFLLPVMGIGSALTAIASQNFGGKKYHRVYEVYWKSLAIGLSILIIGSVLITMFKSQFAMLINSDPIVQREIVNYLTIEVFTLPSFAILMLSSYIMTAIKKPTIPLWINIGRQLILPITLFTIATTFFTPSLEGLWTSLLIMNWSMGVVALVTAVIILRKQEKEEVMAEKEVHDSHHAHTHIHTHMQANAHS